MQFVLLFVSSVLFGACIEAPPVTANNSQNTNNSNTNNSNNSTINNSNTNSENPERLRPFTVKDDLELMYLFDASAVENSIPNRAEINVGIDLLWDANAGIVLAENEIDLGQNAVSVSFANGIVQKFQDKSSMSVELWWRHYWSQDGDIVRIGDGLRIFANSNNNVHEMQIIVGGKTHNLGVVDLDHMSHLVFTMDASVATLYVDGLVVWAHRVEDAFEPFADVEEIVFGQDGGAYLALSKIAVYSRVLRPGEVAMHAYLGPVHMAGPARNDIFAEHYRKGVYQDNLRKEFVEVSIAPMSETDGLTFGFFNSQETGQPLWRVETAKEHLPPQAQDLHGYARLEITSLNAPANTSFNLSAFEIRRPWTPSDVSWTQATDEQAWQLDGAQGTEDRGQAPLDTRELTYPNEFNYSERIFFRLDNVITRWFSGANYGLLFDAELIARGEFETAAALSPALVFFGVAPPLEPTLAEFQIATSNNECRVTAQSLLSQGYKFEVWKNGQFAGISSGSRIDVSECEQGMLEISVIDAFGNRVFQDM